MPPRKRAPPNPSAKPPRTKPPAPPLSIHAPPASPTSAPALPPARQHAPTYHYAQLLQDRAACAALLAWFGGDVLTARSMPWRKTWVDPAEYAGREATLREVLMRRAYEVWVSEVMLQQTRVSTVIPYFNSWIAKWPTAEALAKANHDEVLAVWKGLGYYSRATRLYEGAQATLKDGPDAPCVIPSSATELQLLPGIGRYTAGAISSIAFGEAEPVLDGNVARVLSRQLGLYVDVKDKKHSDTLWEVADKLIKQVSDYPSTQNSAVPGQWNQALMELGSTICTPRPRCDECPISSTCRVYSEGQALADKRQSPTVVPDIEDACTICEQLDTEDLVAISAEAEAEEAPEPAKKRKTAVKQSNTLSNYFTMSTRSSKAKAEEVEEKKVEVEVEESHSEGAKKRKNPASGSSAKSVSSYCSLFPKKVVKKKAAEEECVVCLVELRMPGVGSKWLIEQRPAKGLLASLWQFPQTTLPPTTTTSTQRETAAKNFTHGLTAGKIDTTRARLVESFDPVVHVFTHLRLTMHTYHYRIDVGDEVGDSDEETLVCSGLPLRKWVATGDMEGETLSTGMRKCWGLRGGA